MIFGHVCARVSVVPFVVSSSTYFLFHLVCVAGIGFVLYKTPEAAVVARVCMLCLSVLIIIESHVCCYVFLFCVSVSLCLLFTPP